MNVKIRCPKCGEYVSIQLQPNRTVDSSGLKNFSFIHKDHIFSIYLDSHNFVRGAYIKPLHFATDNNCYFKDYLVLTKVIIGHKFRFAVLWKNKKVIDIRAFPEIVPRIYDFLNSVTAAKLPYRFDTIELNYLCQNGLCLIAPKINTHMQSWLKILLEIFSKTGLPSQNSLAQLLEYLDRNLNRKPTKRDEEFISKLLEKYQKN